MLGGAGHTGEGVRLREQGRTVHIRKSGEYREKLKTKKEKGEKTKYCSKESRSRAGGWGNIVGGKMTIAGTEHLDDCNGIHCISQADTQ